MLKRLIEVALPLKEVSEQSAREKSIRHGHISTLHIWWARRPLAACRAVVFASLIPDPDDAECPESFRQLVMDTLGDSQFRPSRPEPSPGAAAPVEVQPLQDTPRNRCLEFIKHLVRWENSNNPDYIEPARKLIHAAHSILHPDSTDEAPKVLDPFAGGGAIPLEALRLGCEAHAIDINPVAHLIQLCTLVYPQKFGRPLPDDAPVPDYIRDAADKGWLGDADKKAKGLWEQDAYARAEAEYRRNPLAADVKYWGNWVLEKAREELAEFYPPDPDGSVPVAYLWARTVKCANPACHLAVPLVRQLWLCKKTNRKVALRMTPIHKAGRCKFAVVEDKGIDFDPSEGTMRRGQAQCPSCHTVATSKYLQAEGREGRIEQQMLAVATMKKGVRGRRYRVPQQADDSAYAKASAALAALESQAPNAVPSEPLQPWSGVFNAPLFGMATWGGLYNHRQLFSLATISKYIQRSFEKLHVEHDSEYGAAVSSVLTLNLGRLADLSTALCAWEPIAQCPRHLFGRQAIPMVWDYAEGVPPSDRTCSWAMCLARTLDSLDGVWGVGEPGVVARGNASRLPMKDGSLSAIITDPPYYDAVPYSDLSDFFYVWQKRILSDIVPENYRTPLTPKAPEIVSHLGKNYPGAQKTASDYESGMAQSFLEMHRVLEKDGISAVMFAHKTTTAWESVLDAMVRSGLQVSSSWPIHTEMSSRLRGMESAALASSVTIICRSRDAKAGEGVWDDVRRELREVAIERLDFFWNQGIRGADFFISAIGPALSVFGRYERVVRLSGEAVTVGQFLQEVRELVTDYATRRIFEQAKQDAPVNFHGGQRVDSETQFYVMWRWSYGETKVPADEAFKLAQALGFDTEMMWGKTGVLEKKSQDVTVVPIAKRMRMKNLGEPPADGVPASIIDTLHRLCGFRDKGDVTGAAEFLARSGHARDEALWLVAQAVSEILPDGDKEKQLMQGLLNQRDALLQAASESAGLF